MSEIQSGHITFIEACPPPLDAGEYRITVEQEVTATGSKALPKSVKYFSIQGPRFTLGPNDIDSVYPIKNHAGRFDNCLPHITLARKTLPWERTLDTNPVKRIENNKGEPLNITPWLALLTFHDEEIKVTNMTLKDILDPPSGIMGPKISLDTTAGEKDSDACIAVDIPLDLVVRIMPREDELKYLAHVRYTSMEHKEVNSGNSDGYFSTIISNRFPKSSDQGIENRVHLVSLEGFSQLFDVDKIDRTKYKTVRMVSLYHWSFTSQKEKYNFKELVETLCPSRTLYFDTETNASTEQERIADQALKMGYIGLNHITREGEKTVSWYRGPLVPLKIQDNKDTKKPFPCADALVRYNPETGLFDVSYAAAWQLGRLLALQNKHFAVALFNWRRKNHREMHLIISKGIMQNKLNGNRKVKDSLKIAKHVSDSSIKDMILEYCKEDVLMKMFSSANAKESIMGRHADPSGISEHMEEYPGLLPKEKLNAIIKKRKVRQE